MSALSNLVPAPLHKPLGRLKCRLLDELPYARSAAKIPKFREQLVPLVAQLSPIKPAQKTTIEIHMLCGKRDLNMGILASWSLMRFLNGEAHLIVHSDGSLDDEDLTLWRDKVAHISLISRKEAEKRAAETLAGNEKLLDWRESNWASAQLVDAHLFGSQDRVLLMDSDVLVFRPPIQVIEALTSKPKALYWCRDLLDAYSAPKEHLEALLEQKIPSRLCAGFMVSPRLTVEDFSTLNATMTELEKTASISLNHFWSCQTYFAILALRYPHSQAFASKYDNTKSQTQPNQIMRHFVGVPRIRFRYFTEGCEIIRRQLLVTFSS